MPRAAQSGWNSSTKRDPTLTDRTEPADPSVSHALLRQSGNRLSMDFVGRLLYVSPCKCERQAEVAALDEAEKAESSWERFGDHFCKAPWSEEACEHCRSICDCPWKSPLLALMDRRADLNAQAGDGRTPLLAAAQIGRIRLISTLLAWNASVTKSVDKRGRTALHEAAARGHAAMCGLLLEYPSEESDDESYEDAVNMACDFGKTAMLEAARYGHAEVMAMLVQLHADVDAALPDGTNSLMFSAHAGHVDCCKLLLTAQPRPCKVCRGWDQKKQGPCYGKCTNSYHMPVANHEGKNAVTIARARQREGGTWSATVFLLEQHGVPAG